MMRTVAAICVAMLTAAAGIADEAAAFFDDSTVREVRLYFVDANWYNVLYQAHATNADDPYFSGTFKYGDTVLAPVGIRFKGNSSFRRNDVKKSFKIDFNEFDDTLTFMGLKKLNLNDADLQPDFLREKLYLDFASKYIAAMRAVHVRVYVNDVLWGLYIAVEQPDKTMMKSRFGARGWQPLRRVTRSARGRGGPGFRGLGGGCRSGAPAGPRSRGRRRGTGRR